MKQYYVRYLVGTSSKEYVGAIDIDECEYTAIETMYKITCAIAKKHTDYYFVISYDSVLVLNINALN